MPTHSITYKQLEAIYWIGELNGFHAAALKLHTTQSAVSKRVKDLEEGLGLALFDRSRQAAKLTPRGREFWLVAKQLLAQRDRALEGLKSHGATMPARVRMGMSEITAMTWLPRLVKEVRRAYPGTELALDVGTAMDIAAKLHADQLEVAILPQMLLDHRLAQTVLGWVDYVLVSAPHAWRGPRAVKAADLAVHTLLMQCPDTSATARMFVNWAQTQQLPVDDAICCNSLHALIGMALSGIGVALSGIGVAFLPRVCVAGQLRRGTLVEITLAQAPGPVAMAMAHAPRPAHHYIHALVAQARACCAYDLEH
jgi:DNA-binding transcriptional LysR family regulator